MNENIKNAVAEAINEAVESQLSDIKFNLCQVFGGLLYSLKLECEKQGGVGDIDKLINIVVNTTHREGPDEESYPDYNRKAVEGILNRLEGVLQAHGVEQSWNIGRGKVVG